MRNNASLEKMISYILVTGVLASIILSFLGLILYYLENRLCLEISFNEQSTLLLGRFFIQANRVNSYTLLSASILIVLFTPYVRVFTSMIYFMKIKDYKYVILTFTVFIALTIMFLVH
jgi:uncharacterized membrane protein